MRQFSPSTNWKLGIWSTLAMLAILISGCAKIKPKLAALLAPSPVQTLKSQQQQDLARIAAENMAGDDQSDGRGTRQDYNRPNTPNPLRQPPNYTTQPQQPAYDANGYPLPTGVQQVGFQEGISPAQSMPELPSYDATDAGPVGSGMQSPQSHTSPESRHLSNQSHPHPGQPARPLPGRNSPQYYYPGQPATSYPAQAHPPHPVHSGNPNIPYGYDGIQSNQDLNHPYPQTHREGDPDRIVHTRGNELYQRPRMASERALELYDENQKLKDRITKLEKQLVHKDEELADLNKSREMLWREITEFRKQIEQLEANNSKTLAKLKLAELDKERLERETKKTMDEIESLLMETMRELPDKFQPVSNATIK